MHYIHTLCSNINEFRCYEVKIEESEKKPAAARSRTQDTSGLSRQCSATELQQPDNHQPSHIVRAGGCCSSVRQDALSTCVVTFDMSKHLLGINSSTNLILQ